MPEYFLFFILLIAALSHAICHSILKHNNNPLGILGITSIFEIIIFTPLVFFVPFISHFLSRPQPAMTSLGWETFGQDGTKQAKVGQA